MKEIILEEDYGSAKKGDTFVQGLHGVPRYYIDGVSKPEDWYWEKGTTPDQNRFLPASVFEVHNSTQTSEDGIM